MSTNIKINGKDVTKEDVTNFLNKLNLNLSDLNKNNIPDIVDTLSKKGVSGKVVGSVINTYLNQKTKGGDTVVSVLQNKISDIEKNITVNTGEISKTATHSNEPIILPGETNEISKDYSGTNIPITTPITNSNPFLQVLIYAAIAALITGVIVAIIK